MPQSSSRRVTAHTSSRTTAAGVRRRGGFRRYGLSAAMVGGEAILGGPSAGSERGAAYLFGRVEGQWRQRREFVPDEGGADFGRSVAYTGGVAVLGAPGTGRAGRASVVREADGWTETRRLVAEDFPENPSSAPRSRYAPRRTRRLSRLPGGEPRLPLRAVDDSTSGALVRTQNRRRRFSSPTVHRRRDRHFRGSPHDVYRSTIPSDRTVDSFDGVRHRSTLSKPLSDGVHRRSVRDGSLGRLPRVSAESPSSAFGPVESVSSGSPRRVRPGSVAGRAPGRRFSYGRA
jgi:hypothetical protein